MRFLNDTSVTMLRTAHTSWKMVVRVNPLKAATSTKWITVSSPTKRIIGAKNMEMSSPAAMVRKRLCILKNIIGRFYRFAGTKIGKNRKTVLSLVSL